ncbi:Myelin protein P0, partial [Ophiophagus hannah]
MRSTARWDLKLSSLAPSGPTSGSLTTFRSRGTFSPNVERIAFRYGQVLGGIIGGVLAVVLVVLLIAYLIRYCWLRRQATLQRRLSPSPRALASTPMPGWQMMGVVVLRLQTAPNLGPAALLFPGIPLLCNAMSS